MNLCSLSPIAPSCEFCCPTSKDRSVLHRIFRPGTRVDIGCGGKRNVIRKLGSRMYIQFSTQRSSRKYYPGSARARRANATVLLHCTSRNSPFLAACRNSVRLIVRKSCRSVSAAPTSSAADALYCSWLAPPDRFLEQFVARKELTHPMPLLTSVLYRPRN